MQWQLFTGALTYLHFLTIVIWLVDSTVGCAEEPLATPRKVVTHTCGWPNLTPLGENRVALLAFNQPSHGQEEGDIACWMSEDGGEKWQLRGPVTRHDPQTVRMNHAAGLTDSGDLLALVSGWSNMRQPNAPKRAPFRDTVLNSWICRSTNQGRTWQVTTDGVPLDPKGRTLIPFGDIVLSENGRLNVVVYATSYWDKPKPWAAYFLTSADDGRTWKVRSKIDDGVNETAPLYLGDGHWLVVARAANLALCRSTDDGETWHREGPVTQKRQLPGHLLTLADGRVLLSYGDRRPGHLGIRARLSADQGHTWSEPLLIAPMAAVDGGYPASWQRSDGQVLTVYYSKNRQGTDYAVWAAIWNPEHM